MDLGLELEFVLTDDSLGVFDDLESYSTEAKDDAVLGKVEYQTKGDREVEITIEAFQVKAKKEEQARDEL